MLELEKDRDLLGGNGIKTSFDYDFYIQTASDIELYIIDSVTKAKSKQLLDTDYTVSHISTDPLGFRVNYKNVVLSSSQYSFAIRKMPFTQLLDLGVVTEYDERKITNALDKLTALSQQNAIDIKQCVKVADESTLESIIMPGPQAGKSLKWDSDGALVNSDNDIDGIVETVQSYSNSASSSASQAASSQAASASSAALALSYKITAESNAISAAASAASVNIPSPAGNGLKYIRQKATEDGFEYRTASQMAADLPISLVNMGDIYGLVPSNNVSDSNNKIDVSSGFAASDDAVPIKIALSSLITKRLDSVFAEGSNQGGLNSGTKAANTWYELYIIAKTNGTTDIMFSTYANRNTLPSGFVYKRRIGHVLTDSSSNIKAFISNLVGKAVNYQWKTSVQNLTSGGTANTRTNLTMTVPPINVEVQMGYSCTSEGTSVHISHPDVNDEAPGYTSAIGTLGPYASASGYYKTQITNSSGQISYRADKTNVLGIRTFGYTDFRTT